MNPTANPNAPAPILAALRGGAALVLSLSGGKDSQAMLNAVLRHPDRPNWTGPIVAVHADLGRAEWNQTAQVVADQAAAAGVPLTIVQRTKGDLFDRIEARADQLAGTGKPPWPSAAMRYCTSDLKRTPINGFLRSLGDLVVSVEGVRADESAARAKKPAVQVRGSITGQAFRQDPTDPKSPFVSPEDALVRLADGASGRLAFDWRPVLAYAEADVWSELGTSAADLGRRRQAYGDDPEAALAGWPGHPAYVFGNVRLSCAFCVLGCRPDLVNAARHQPETLRFLVGIEDRTGFTFKADLSLRDIALEAGVSLPSPVNS